MTAARRLVIHSPKAVDAFVVHAALLRAEAHDPDLRRNPQWTMTRQDAYERFALYMSKNL
jgi:hypothetical protein